MNFSPSILAKVVLVAATAVIVSPRARLVSLNKLLAASGRAAASGQLAANKITSFVGRATSTTTTSTTATCTRWPDNEERQLKADGRLPLAGAKKKEKKRGSKTTNVCAFPWPSSGGRPNGQPPRSKQGPWHVRQTNELSHFISRSVRATPAAPPTSRRADGPTDRQQPPKWVRFSARLIWPVWPANWTACIPTVRWV